MDNGYMTDNLSPEAQKDIEFLENIADRLATEDAAKKRKK